MRVEICFPQRFHQAVDGIRIRCWLEMGGEIQLLDDIQWADWDQGGQLLVATRSGKLQARHLVGDSPEVLFEEDLSFAEPNPAPAPAWAQHW